MFQKTDSLKLPDGDSLRDPPDLAQVALRSCTKREKARARVKKNPVCVCVFFLQEKTEKVRELRKQPVVFNCLQRILLTVSFEASP